MSGLLEAGSMLPVQARVSDTPLQACFIKAKSDCLLIAFRALNSSTQP